MQVNVMATAFHLSFVQTPSASQSQSFYASAGWSPLPSGRDAVWRMTSTCRGLSLFLRCCLPPRPLPSSSAAGDVHHFLLMTINVPMLIKAKTAITIYAQFYFEWKMCLGMVDDANSSNRCRQITRTTGFMIEKRHKTFE